MSAAFGCLSHREWHFAARRQVGTDQAFPHRERSLTARRQELVGLRGGYETALEGQHRLFQTCPKLAAWSTLAHLLAADSVPTGAPQGRGSTGNEAGSDGSD